MQNDNVYIKLIDYINILNTYSPIILTFLTLSVPLLPLLLLENRPLLGGLQSEIETPGK